MQNSIVVLPLAAPLHLPMARQPRRAAASASGAAADSSSSSSSSSSSPSGSSSTSASSASSHLRLSLPLLLCFSAGFALACALASGSSLGSLLSVRDGGGGGGGGVGAAGAHTPLCPVCADCAASAAVAGGAPPPCPPPPRLPAAAAAAPPPAPPPPPPPRIAVCVTGQVRTLNLREGEPFYPPSWNPQRRGSTPAAELAGMSVAESVQARLYPALGDAFDVFMVVATRGGPREPAVGDASACEPLRPRGAGSHHLHCDVYAEQELPLWGDLPRPTEGRDPQWWPEAFSPVWRHYTLPGREQQLLQQLHDQWRCLEAVKLRERRTGARYSHIVRSRPDVAFHAPVPRALASLDYGSADAPRVLTTARADCCCGNDDWFNVGERDVMERFLSRFLLLQALRHPLLDSAWTAEDFAKAVLEPIGAQLQEEPALTACLLKPTYRIVPGEP